MPQPSEPPAPVLDPAARALADQAAAGPDPRRLPLSELRARLDLAQSGPVDRPDAQIEDLSVAGPDGPVRVRLVRPTVHVPSPLPVILYLHGGGWIAGSVVSHDRLVRELAVGVGAAVVFVDYDLAPEAPYPTALRQARAAAHWVVDHGPGQGLDPARMAVAGDSAGGNLAAALTLLAKEHGEFAFRHQVLIHPPLSADCDTDSYRRFARGYFQSADHLRWLWQQYVPDPARRSEPTAAPLNTELHQLTGLPPALVITAEADAVRDEAEAYAAKLRTAGVPVTCVRYQGTVHAFVVLDALRGTSAARAALAQIVATLREALHPPQEIP
ncbi:MULTISPECIES: alpha/beta hydrolase [Kitasatospora]|uniref:Alpha/beta hydrolase n=1 Tax=Kitasatospora cathayae TaxID=3004092 RepID=A0ABY7PWR9_9ACTN|nr:alpha/beta hydrolase [Kitasatospora sp. HUAS 3-15]WBP84826.1 alpha/beta hydrolase [Kitasatospora sp. HUAS 3-15]